MGFVWMIVALATFFSSCFQGTTAYNCLFIGHSFFIPIAQRMPLVTSNAGVSHEQVEVFSGGASGAPEALWNNNATRNEAQGYLDTGDIELFGLTYEPTFPTTTGYELWFDYALSKNPNTVFMLGLPWLDFPSEYDAENYASMTRIAGVGAWEILLTALRSMYPGVTIIDVPYGLGVAELRLLFEAGLLPELSAVQGPMETSLHTDRKGHAGSMIREISPLFWLNRIYNVELSAYDGPLESSADLKGIATSVLDAYDSGSVCGSIPCSCVDDDATIAENAASIGETWVSGCSDVADRCQATGQEGNQVRRHCCATCFFSGSADNSANLVLSGGTESTNLQTY